MEEIIFIEYILFFRHFTRHITGKETVSEELSDLQRVIWLWKIETRGILIRSLELQKFLLLSYYTTSVYKIEVGHSSCFTETL